MSKIENISIDQARKLVLLSQELPSTKKNTGSENATLKAIEHLGYIQIDTISVVQRAHHHTLWNRNPSYKTDHIDKLFKNKEIFEYWSHAAAYLPMKDYRYSLVRKNEIINGHQKHWFKRNEELEKFVLDKIKNEGPLMAKDFEHLGPKMKEWQLKPAKQALENLFMEGKLMIPKRVNFHKLYDLTEQVLPEGIDTSVPSQQEYARFLITNYLRANGVGKQQEINYLLKNTKQIVSQTVNEMLEAGELLEVKVKDDNYYMLPSSMELLNKRLMRSKLKILSPFDNLVIQRKRVKNLFDYDYQIECYVPEAKRQYGYFSLPVLWNGRLVARMDCKADRKTSILQIKNLVLESWLRKTDDFLLALVDELNNFMLFNECNRIEVLKVNRNGFVDMLRTELKELNILHK